jgi:hypothetical protein
VRARSSIIAISMGILALSLGLEWFGVRSARRAEAALREIDRQRAAVDAGVARAAERLAAAARERTALGEALHGLPPGRGSPVAADGTGDAADVAALLAANPRLFALGVRAYRANLGLHFGSLYRSLALAPDQIERFEDLMTRHQEDTLDLNAAAAARGLDDADPAVVALRGQEDEQLRAAQAALLGEAGFQQLQQFNREQPVGDIVTNVATTMALSSTPLSSAQAGQLTRFLADASSAYQSGNPADTATIDWDQVLSQAQGILSNAQYEALKAEYLKPQLDQLHAQFNQHELEKK